MRHLRVHRVTRSGAQQMYFQAFDEWGSEEWSNARRGIGVAAKVLQPRCAGQREEEELQQERVVETKLATYYITCTGLFLAGKHLVEPSSHFCCQCG